MSDEIAAYWAARPYRERWRYENYVRKVLWNLREYKEPAPVFLLEWIWFNLKNIPRLVFDRRS